MRFYNQAEIAMIESNLQKGLGNLSHSEKAELIYRRNEALKHQGRRTDLKESSEEIETTEKEFHLSRSTITRYLKVYRLTDELKELLDQGKIALKTAVNVSNLDKELQKHLHWLITEEERKITEKQSMILVEMQKQGVLDHASMEEALKNESDGMHKIKSYKLPKMIYQKYFSINQDEQEITEIIENALKKYFMEDETLSS